MSDKFKKIFEEKLDVVRKDQQIRKEMIDLVWKEISSVLEKYGVIVTKPNYDKIQIRTNIMLYQIVIGDDYRYYFDYTHEDKTIISCEKDEVEKLYEEITEKIILEL